MQDASLSVRSRIRFAAIGLAAAIGGAAALGIANAANEPSGQQASYTATFGRAGQGLDTRSDVKVRGITVGRVSSLRLGPDGRVKVGLQISKDIHLPPSAVARIEPVSVFGPKVVTLDLGAGNPARRLPDGGTIANTKDPSDPADTATPAFDLTHAIDPDDVATITHSLSSGLAGQGLPLRRTIDNGTRIVDAIHDDQGALQSLLRNVGMLADTLGAHGRSITSAAADFTALAPALNRRPDQISRLLDQSARLSDHFTAGLAASGDSAARLIDGAAAVAHVIAPRTNDLSLLIDSLNGLFSGLAGIIRVPGPEGSLLARGGAFISLDPCQLLVDICPAR